MVTNAVEREHLIASQETRRFHLPTVSIPTVRLPLREAVALGLIIGGVHFMQLSRADIEPKIKTAQAELHEDLQVNAVERYRELLWRNSLPETAISAAMALAGIVLLLPAAKQILRSDN